MESHKSSQLIFDKEQKQHNGTKIAFSINGLDSTKHTHAKKKKIQKQTLCDSEKNSLKWIINLNIKCKTAKLLEYNIGK